MHAAGKAAKRSAFYILLSEFAEVPSTEAAIEIAGRSRGTPRIANEKPELVENYLNRQAALSNDPLVALNTAFAKDGFFLYVPEGVKFEKPIQVINLTRAQEAVFSTQRNLIIAGANSEAKVIFCDHTLTSSDCLGNSVTEVFVGDEAVVDVYSVQNQNNKSNAVNSTFFKLGEKSSYNFV